MVLSLIQQKLLSLPILYVSGYINGNRSEYYRLLRRVSSDADWYAWIGFVLKGFHLQAKATKDLLFKVMEMLENSREHLRSKHKKLYSAELVEALYSSPIITPVSLGKRLDVNYRTASRYLAELVRGKVVGEQFVGKYHLFINKPLLALLKK